MTYTVYILRDFKNRLYVGQTSDLKKRLSRHKAGRGALFVKKGREFELAHSEDYPTLLKAMRREKQLKGWRRVKKEALIAGDKVKLKKL